MKRLFKVLTLVIVISGANFANAETYEELLSNVAATVQKNSPADTEAKAAEIVIVFTHLLTYACKAVAPDAEKTQGFLVEAARLIEKSKNTPGAAPYIQDLQEKIVKLLEVIQATQPSVVQLDSIVANLDKLKAKFPEAQFVEQLDSLVSLVHQFTVGYTNYAQDVAAVSQKYAVIKDMVAAQDPDLGEKLKDLADDTEKVQKYSFADIAKRLEAIETVLKMHYHEGL